MYLVQYSTGSYDDWIEHDLFVTHDKKMADAYAEKMNRIGVQLRQYYNELYNNSDYGNCSEERLLIISEKHYKWGEYNKCYVRPIEVR